ncbi:MAG: hypothetical protein F6J86_24105 [Symploca sp. SIO1B1]|nr:hypothetical protein [Symploca sp. SIO1B1]
MNYRTIKLSAALVATVASLVGFSSVARAGEGGTAGAAAFTVNGTNVTGVAVSAATGKDSAAANSFNHTAGTAAGDLQNSASAIGVGGNIAITGLGSSSVGVTTTAATDPSLVQGNTITDGAGYGINLGTAGGNPVVTP